MKRIIGLLFILVFVTGCGYDYKLVVNPNSIDEEINFSIKDSDYDKAVFINELFRVTNIMYEDDKAMGEFVIDRLRNYDLSPGYTILDYYTKKVDGDKLTLSYRYLDDTYDYSNVFNSCFGDVFFDSNEDYYVINGYNGFKCLVNDKVSVMVETDYRVIESNADKVKGNKYIWNFTSDNNLDHDMYIQVSKNYKAKKNNNFGLYIVIFLFVGFIVYNFFIKGQKPRFISNNEV